MHPWLASFAASSPSPPVQWAGHTVRPGVSFARAPTRVSPQSTESRSTAEAMAQRKVRTRAFSGCDWKVNLDEPDTSSSERGAKGGGEGFAAVAGDAMVWGPDA
jgi:hypothetical protein